VGRMILGACDYKRLGHLLVVAKSFSGMGLDG
jgi:hypothetical protein